MFFKIFFSFSEYFYLLFTLHKKKVLFKNKKFNKSIKKIIRRTIILINHRTIHKLIYYIRKESHFFAKSSIVLPS